MKCAFAHKLPRPLRLEELRVHSRALFRFFKAGVCVYSDEFEIERVPLISGGRCESNEILTAILSQDPHIS